MSEALTSLVFFFFLIKKPKNVLKNFHYLIEAAKCSELFHMHNTGDLIYNFSVCFDFN